MTELKSLVDRWVDKGLISARQGESILAEQGGGLRVSLPRGPLIAEALAYVGGMLVLVAAVIISSIYWPSLSTVGRSTLTGGATALVLGAGILLPQGMGPTRARLRAVLWALAVALCGVWAAVTLDSLRWRGETTTLTATAIAAVLAFVLWWYQRSTLQQAALAITLVGVVTAATTHLPHDSQATIGFSLFIVGLPWLALAWGGLMRPQRTAYLLGGVILVVGALFTTEAEWGLALAGVTVTALVTVAVLLRDLWLLGVGSIGVLITVPIIVDRLFPGRLAAPLALLGAGALLIVLAVATARRRGQAAPTATAWLPPSVSPATSATVAVAVIAVMVPLVLLSGGAFG